MLGGGGGGGAVARVYGKDHTSQLLIAVDGYILSITHRIILKYGPLSFIITLHSYELD